MPEPFFSSEVMTRLQVKLGVSDRKLLEAANLSENDEKFVLIAIDFEKGNITDQMKASLKKF